MHRSAHLTRRSLTAALLALLMTASAAAQDAVRLARLPDVHVLTALKSGEWDDLDELMAEALQEIDAYADTREIKLEAIAVVIYEAAGLKTFRARIGYVVDAAVKPRPGRYEKSMELRRLTGRAYVASGTGGMAEVIALRRKVLDALEQPGARRVKGVETIELFYGDLDDKNTKVEVYGPVR
jgi:hypothetical protein